MDNKQFWSGITITLSGVLTQVYGLINILYYLFTVIGAAFYSIKEDCRLEYAIEEYMDKYDVHINFWAILIIFIVGLIYTNMGIEKLSTAQSSIKGQLQNKGSNTGGYFSGDVKSSPNTINSKAAPREKWECSKCGFINKGSSSYCADCGNHK